MDFFWLAGLLPPEPEVDEEVEEILYLFERMTPEAREHFRVIARAFVHGRAGNNKDPFVQVGEHDNS